jgi:predicted phosphodiesterase
VNWNYHPRTTTYISAHELQAQILSADIATNTAGYITVTNPAPGGGSSSASWAQVEVHDPISTIILDPQVYYDFGGWQLQAADFNHDAVLDLVDGYELDRGEGNGAFKFWSIVDWDFLSPYQFAYGDFHNDGNLDVVTPSAFGSTEGFDPTRMDVMLGNAEGTFTSGTPIFSKAQNFSYVLAGDFNQDGNLDLITKGDYELTTYLGNGDGSFRLGVQYPYPRDAFEQEMLSGDFNGDGKLDLILLKANAPEINMTLWLLKGNGDGTFGRPQQIAIVRNTATCDGAPAVQVSDFDGDGKLDLAFCDSSQIGVMLGNGDGTFQPPTFYTADSTGSRQFAFAIGDINSDGKQDLLVSEYANSTNPQLAILLGNGDGTFQPPQMSSAIESELGIVVGDFNSDGLPDFIFQSDKGMNVFLQQ